MSTSRSKTTTTSTISLSLLLSLFLVSYTLSSSDPTKAGPSSALRTTLLVLAGLSLVSVCLVVVARTTMVAWIMVLVVLAFSGKRRRVIVHERRKITTDVAMHILKVMFKERQFVTVICAIGVSLMAMAQVTRF